MTKWILGPVLALALVGAPAAQAEPFTPELEADYSSALAWWGVPSPPQCASVSREVLPADPFTPQDGIEAAMRATQPEPGEAGIECHVYVFSDALEATEAAWRIVAGCLIEREMRHEVGHLLGYGHSADPRNVMYPTATVTACLESREWTRWRIWRDRCSGFSPRHRARCRREVQSYGEELKALAQ